jgi:hypothetical protein
VLGCGCWLSGCTRSSASHSPAARQQNISRGFLSLLPDSARSLSCAPSLCSGWEAPRGAAVVTAVAAAIAAAAVAV